MHRMLMTAVALSAALLIGTGAFAQVPADPNNPNENVPEKYNYTPYGENIKLDMAKKIADAAMAEAVKRNWPMCISVVDTSGELVYFEKMDECQYASINISQHKARAAARYRRPTVVFERLLGKGAFFAYLPTLGDAFIASRGGNPIVVGGKIIGAIGVSGGTGSQDDTISQAGAHSVH
ncbi:MAG TPA: heme-binding protein [Pseudolabrys sp.]|nr:heme-binding protein [Pseudolabrys sp.]